MTPDLLLPYAGTEPVFATPPLWCGRGSTVIGRASLGAEAWLGDDTVIRGDGHDIIAGDRLRLGPRATLHIAQDKYPCILGDRVTVGRNAVVHACTIGDDCVIEADCVVLDGSVVEDGVLIEAGSTVFPRSTLASGFAYAGSPAEPTRRLAPGDLAAEAGPIAIGPNVNVQDNSVLRTEGSGLVIERDTTLGHNVRVADGQIGPRSLIGIGAVLAPGTVVGEDVLVAAGAWTEPGQVLESGWLWGGRPARRLGPLDAGKREMMRRIVQQYAGYGRTYRKAQAALLPPSG